MKKKTVRILAALLLGICVPACALAYDANIAQAWLEQFSAALVQITPINDPDATADPARAGQMLFAYDFGTVLSKSDHPGAQDIQEIEIRNAQVTDCRGVRVGMDIGKTFSGQQPGKSVTPLYVLGTQENGWHWAYLKDGQVYGVEYIAYGEAAQTMKEYTLTYVIENNTVTTIRMRMAEVSQAQAMEGVETAREILARQHGEILAMQSNAPVFNQEDLSVNGSPVLGRPVYELIAHMGEPEEIQTLPEGKGRILIYGDAAVRLALDERTGVEIVRGVSTTGMQTMGPRRLSVGLSVQEATSLFLCENEISSLGGTLYLAGESLDDPPYGRLTAVSSGEMLLAYACVTNTGETAMLEAGVRDGVIAYWHLYYLDDAQGGM